MVGGVCSNRTSSISSASTDDQKLYDARVRNVPGKKSGVKPSGTPFARSGITPGSCAAKGARSGRGPGVGHGHD
jgi:hypothetical protein